MLLHSCMCLFANLKCNELGIYCKMSVAYNNKDVQPCGKKKNNPELKVPQISPSTLKKAVKWSEVAQSCLTLCDPMDCSLPGSSVHGIFQARVLEWGAIAFSRSSWPRDWTQVSHIVGRRFTMWATREGYRKLFKKGSTICLHRESSPWHVKYKAVYIYYLGDKVCRRISTQIWLLVIRVA